jgi:acyl carrier protein
LVIGPRGERLLGLHLEEVLREERITHLTIPPSVLATLEPAANGSLRTLVVAGEECPPYVGARWGCRCEVFNAYGPTEVTVCATMSEPLQGDSAAIGLPLSNASVCVLDPHGALAPIGVPGELYVGGAGLARGYLGEPMQTAARFIPDPFSDTPGARLYRTGDLCRARKDGRIELLGRADDQIKIRGHRVELGDIESTLNNAPGIQAVFVKKVVELEEERLVAFLVPVPDASVDLNAVRAFAKSKLPPYMLPNSFYIVESVPLTPNGKVDRASLQIPASQPGPPHPGGAGPSTDMEVRISAIWQTALRLESVSIDDNFFDLGGHSLLMVQVHHKLQEAIGYEFPLITMLQHPTIRAIAVHLGGAKVREEAPLRDVALQQNAFRNQRERAMAARRPM